MQVSIEMYVDGGGTFYAVTWLKILQSRKSKRMAYRVIPDFIFRHKVIEVSFPSLFGRDYRTIPQARGDSHEFFRKLFLKRKIQSSAEYCRKNIERFNI